MEIGERRSNKCLMMLAATLRLSHNSALEYSDNIPVCKHISQKVHVHLLATLSNWTKQTPFSSPLASYALFALKYSAHSSSVTYSLINALYPHARPTAATPPCKAHGTHHRRGPSHHALGNMTIAVALACLRKYQHMSIRKLAHVR